MENKINLTLDPFGTKVAAEAEKIAETAVATEEKIKELRSLTEANLTPT